MAKKTLSYFVPMEYASYFMAEFRAHGITKVALNADRCVKALSEDGYLEKEVRLYRSFGLEFAGAHAPWGPGWDVTEFGEDCRKRLIAGHKRLLQELGALGIRTYTIHPHAGFNPNLRQDAEIRDNAISALEELVPVAEKSGIVIAIENNFTPPCTGASIVDILRYFNSPFLGANYDTGHGNILEDAPGKKFSDLKVLDYWKLYPQEFQHGQLELMLPYLVTCHLHDNDGTTDSHLLPGDGNIDWKRIMTLISSAPNLIEYQCEVNFVRNSIPLDKVFGTFTDSFLEP